MRRATINDLDAVNTLLAEFGRQVERRELADPWLHVGISDDDMALGAIYFARDLGRWAAHATSMVVRPDARGRGLSHQIVKWFTDEAAEFVKMHGGPMRMFGYSNPSREATKHLLTNAGWKHIGEARGDHGSHLWAVDFD